MTVRQEVSPKYVVGNKRYGRKTLPFHLDDFESLADDEDNIDVSSSTKSLKRSYTSDDVTDTDEVSVVYHIILKAAFRVLPSVIDGAIKMLVIIGN